MFSIRCLGIIPSFFLLLSLSGQAQIRVIEISKMPFGESAGGPDITINKKNTQVIVAVSPNNQLFQSTDQGKSWVGSGTPKVGREASLVGDRKGNLYHVYVEQVNDSICLIQCNHSSDGMQWNKKDGLDFRGCLIAQPSIAIHPKTGNIFLTYLSKPNLDASYYRVYFSQSGGGRKWSDPRIISSSIYTTLARPARGPFVAVNLDELLFSTWSSDSSLFFDRSFDRKANMWLSNDIKVVNRKVPLDSLSKQSKAVGSAQIFIDNSSERFSRTLFLVWEDQRDDAAGSAIWLQRSTNYGDSWTAPVRITEKGSGKDEFMPVSAVDPTTGYLYILYYSQPQGEDSVDLCLAYSTDNGEHFKSVRVVEGITSSTVVGKFAKTINIDVYQGIITPIWTQAHREEMSLYMATLSHEDLIKLTHTKE